MIQVSDINISDLPSVEAKYANRIPKKMGVYFIAESGNIVYVGKSKCLLNRCRNHQKLKEIENSDNVRVSWLELDSVSDSELGIIEQQFISMLLPKLNVVGCSQFDRWLNENPRPDISKMSDGISGSKFNKMISLRPSDYDVKVLEKIREDNPTLTDAVDLIRVALHVCGLMFSNRQAEEQAIRLKIEELKERIAKLESTQK